VPPAQPTPSGGAARRRSTAAFRIIGIAVAVAAVALCVKTIVSEWSRISSAVANADIAPLLLAFVCSAGSMIGLGLLWWRCLRLFGSPTRPSVAVGWYFGGELGKYLPGGVWPVLGRGELAQRGGRIDRSAGYATTLICYGLMCIAAAVVCGVLAPFLSVGGGSLGATWIMLLLIPLGIAAVHPAVFGRILAVGRRITRGGLDFSPPTWSSMLRLMVWSLPTWVLLGLASVLVTEALGYHQHPERVAFAAISAWIIGFLAVPVPAGAGLRELVFVGVCGLDAAPATAVAAIARGLLLLVDGVGGVAGLWYTRATIRDTRTSSDSARGLGPPETTEAVNGPG
jgi:glycosyltransferase 2 family protein